MTGKRKEATDYICKWVEEILPKGGASEKIRTQLDSLSDQQFHDYMVKLASGEEIVPIEAPNMRKPRLDVARNLKVAEKLGHDFYERIWLYDPATGKSHLTPHRYMIVDLPLRRQQQMLVEKMSIPESNRHIDEMTGQPTGASKASSLTFPELNILYARGMDQTIRELAKFRGGDVTAFQRMDRIAQENGEVSLDAVEELGPTRVKSTETQSVLLTCMHLSNNL